MNSSRTIGMVLTFAGVVSLSTATVSLAGICARECGYVQTTTDLNNFGYWFYPDTMQCFESRYITLGQGDQPCETENSKITLMQCHTAPEWCDNNFGNPKPSREMGSPDHDDCTPLMDDIQAYCHSDHHGS